MDRLLFLDNRDSFTWNLVQAFEMLGVPVDVIGSHAIRADDAVGDDAWRGVVLGPGPGRPEQAGVTEEVVRLGAGRRPILGVCLGHQAIATAFGATIVRARDVVHGKTTEIEHDGVGMFRGVPSPFSATRYNSLVVEPATLPPELDVHARTVDGTIMGIRHRRMPLEGVQFHPEAILSEHGATLLQNWLVEAGFLAAPRES